MPSFFTINLNASRNLVRALPKDKGIAEARRSVKFFLLPQDPMGGIADSMIPDHMVSDGMVNRYLEISPPLASVIPEFQLVIDEIERSYVLGMMFSAVSASCIAIERVLNLARIQLHKHHATVKQLWNKGPLNDWNENIDALAKWGYLEEEFSDELKRIYKDIRCQYLHSGSVADVATHALKSVNAVYELLTIFLGFPADLFRFTSGIECLNESDPRFIEFYLPQLRVEP
jgi:hypothetical protein